MILSEKSHDLLIPQCHLHRPVFSRGEVDYLSGSEIAFWSDLIEKYLYPLDADKQKQVRNMIMVISSTYEYVYCNSYDCSSENVQYVL